MGLPTQALQTIVNYGRAWFRTSFPGFPMGVRQFFGLSARALGGNAWMVGKSIDDLDQDIVPSAQSSTTALSNWATLLALPNGAGGFGPLLPTPAVGGVATLTGTLGTVFPQGTIATAEDGSTQIELAAAVTIPGAPPGAGSVVGKFTAVTPGSVGDLPAGTVLTWNSPPPGADTTFQLTTGLGSGEDNEANSSIFSRIRSRLQTPPNGGNSEDYTLWAEVTAGIVAVYVYPKRSGTGTVDVVPLLGSSGVGRVPAPSQITAISNYINTVIPVDVDFFNVLAAFTAASGHKCVVKVVVAPGFEFDWDDRSGGPFTVDLYTPGAPTTLRLNTVAPASLTTAIDAFKNGGSLAAPRLQVLSTGSVVNAAVTAVDYVTGGGKTTLTLGVVPSTFIAPTIGDTVNAYGPVVPVIAPGILQLADGLGPSKQSGYADAFHFWNDTLAVNQLVRVAEDAVDSNGVPMIEEVPTGGATIDGATLDVEASDATTNPPELLYLAQVAVVAA